MKTMLLLMALLIGLPAVAQEERDPTPGELYWFVFASLSNSPDAVEQVHGAGLSEAAAIRLVNYAKDATAQVETFSKQYAADICTKKGATNAQLASYFEARQEDEQKLQANLAANLGIVLSAAEEAQFRAWVLENYSPTAVDGAKPSEILRGQRMTADEVIGIFCGKEQSK